MFFLYFYLKKIIYSLPESAKEEILRGMNVELLRYIAIEMKRRFLWYSSWLKVFEEIYKYTLHLKTTYQKHSYIHYVPSENVFVFGFLFQLYVHPYK